MSPGEIRNEEYMRRAKLYQLKKLSELLPRKISPTDIDGLHLVHDKLGDHGILIEFKTQGASLKWGQQLAFEALIDWCAGRLWMVQAEHDELDTVEVTSDVLRFRVAGLIGGEITYSDWLHGKHLPSLVRALYEPEFRNRMERFVSGEVQE